LAGLIFGIFRYLHNYDNTILQKLLGAFDAFNQNFRKFGDSGKWYRNFKENDQAGLLCTNRTRQDEAGRGRTGQDELLDGVNDDCKSKHII